MRLGDIIKRWRMWNEITIRDLAEQIGVHYTVLSRFENGESVSGDNLSSIITWALGAMK